MTYRNVKRLFVQNSTSASVSYYRTMKEVSSIKINGLKSEISNGHWIVCYRNFAEKLPLALQNFAGEETLT